MQNPSSNIDMESQAFQPYFVSVMLLHPLESSVIVFDTMYWYVYVAYIFICFLRHLRDSNVLQHNREFGRVTRHNLNIWR